MGDWTMALLGPAALLLSAVLTPWTMHVAKRIGAVDVPRDGRRMHQQATPRAGGLALFAAVTLCSGATGLPTGRLRALLLGAALLVGLGLLDDALCLRAPLKLSVQLIAAALTLGGGGWEGVPLRGTALRFGAAVLWLTLSVNAHNMIDGLDGLCAGVSAVEALCLAVVLSLQGDGAATALALCVLGASLGFLLYNRHPARVFMGDTGSQLLGLLLGVLALQVNLSRAGALGPLVPLLTLALPLSDLAFAVVRRALRGQGLFAADRGHWHHRLVDGGMGHAQACRWLCTMSAVLGGVGVLACREDWYGYAVYATLSALALVLLLETGLARRRVGKKRG